MKIPAGKKFTVEVQQIQGGGHPFVVRVRRRGLLCRCPVSTDWFLNEQQAKEFAASAAEDLANGQSADTLRQRPPGWHLKRPLH
jgi:hypothetical protein